MGLQSNIADISSDSIPLILLSLIATCVSYLHSLLETMGLLRVDSDEFVPPAEGPRPLGSGLTGLILLADQLNLNTALSFRHGGGGSASDCVVCLCGMEEGDQVRKLTCRHVFHKECFDGWLDRRNFTCPLCRSPLVSERRLAETERRVGGDVVTWFGIR